MARIVNCIGMFVLKRPEIGYHYGMTYLVGLILSIFSAENEIFLLFCYLIEAVFPYDFFVADSRQLGMHKELRTVVNMAVVLRPKLMNTLVAVFKPARTDTRETDTTPFVLFIKRTVESWIKCLFVPYLMLEDAYRAWDHVFIFGFEFITKFSLTLLSKNETFIKNTIKQETKALGLGISVDSLIIAGTLTRLKLLRKLEKLPIEKLIKKSMTKSSYSSLKRTDLLPKATLLEQDNLSRLIRLRQSHSLLRSKSFPYSSALGLINTMFSISSQDQISRGLFISITSKELQWDSHLSSNLYVTFDQQGSDTLSTRQISVGIAILAQCSLEEKLMLAYLTNTVSNSGTVAAEALCETIAAMEEALDCRSKVVRNNLSGIRSVMARTVGGVEMQQFVDWVKEDSICEVIIKIIAAVESVELVSSIEMNIANIAAEGDYSNTHSPMRTSSITTPKSDLSYEGPDAQELDLKLQKLARSYNRTVEKEHTKVVFQYEESDCEGRSYIDIEIKNEYSAGVVKFIFHIGDIKQLHRKGISNEDSREVTLSKTQEFSGELGRDDNEFEVSISETMRPIEFPEKSQTNKERNGCSRLCSSEKCLIY